jgi:class 3 adenylate cyclase
VQSERLDRRLVAVMFTDMVGYTALIQADERLGLDKRDRYMSVLETHHEAFGGTVVQQLGDGSMSFRGGSCDPDSGRRGRAAPHACMGSAVVPGADA